MQEELFDVFDENNSPIGIIKPRSEIHCGHNNWHRTTHIWIVNKDREILCQRRSENRDSDPGKWQSFFGGHLSADETYESNAVRELKEEIGIIINRSDLKPIYVRQSDKVKHFAQIFILGIDKNTKFIFNDNEVDKVEWFSIDKLKKEINNEVFCNGVDEKVFEYLNK